MAAMKLNAVCTLLVSSFIILASVPILTSNTLYMQFVHSLLSSNVATAQSQSTLAPQSMSSPSLTSSVSSLPDVFQKVENSVVQITSTKSNPNQVIILNGVPSTGKSTALGSGFSDVVVLADDSEDDVIIGLCIYFQDIECKGMTPVDLNKLSSKL